MVDTELDLIDFLGQMLNGIKAKEQGYTAPTRWLNTREDLKEEFKKEALKMFSDWRDDELKAKYDRDNIVTQNN